MKNNFLEQTHSFDFHGGVQVNDRWVKESHHEIHKHLSNSDSEFEIHTRSTGNGLVIGIKSESGIRVYEINTGYKIYEYRED